MVFSKLDLRIKPLVLYGLVAFVVAMPIGLFVQFFVGPEAAVSNSAFRPDNAGALIDAIWVPFLGPMFEEVLFRVLPIGLAYFVVNKYASSSKVCILVVVSILSSFVFSSLHGNWYNLFVQFPLGLLLSFVFVEHSITWKQENLYKAIFRGFVASSVVHIVYNSLGYLLTILLLTILRAQA